MNFVEHQIELDGRSTSFLDNNSDSEEAILLIHGWYCRKELYAPLLDVLPKHYRIVVPDLWGYGKSAKDPDLSYSLEVFQRNLTLLVKQVLGQNKIVLIGHSMGGMIAASLYLDSCLQDLRAIVFLHPIAGFGHKSKVLRWMMKLFVASKRMVEGIIQKNFVRRLSEGNRLKVLDLFTQTPFFVAKRTFLNTVRTFRLEFNTETKGDVPILVIGGTYDEMLPASERLVQFFQDHHLECEYRRLETAHFSFLETPNLYGRLVRDFLAKLGR